MDLISALNGKPSDRAGVAVGVRRKKHLGDAITEIPEDLADYFESRGDTGEVRKAIGDYRVAVAARREHRRATGHGLVFTPDEVQKCWNRIASVLEKMAPGLEFVDG